MSTPLNQQPITPLEQQQILVAGAAGDTFWHRVRFHLVGQAATRSGADTVLDIGAGSGQLGDWLVAQGRPLAYRFEETSPVLDEALAAHFGADHRNEMTAPIPATTLVTMLDVLEHIEHDTAALSTINGRMAPGGQLLLTVPAFQWAFTSWDTALGHHRRYSKRQVTALATASGFEVTSRAYLFPELLPLVAVRKLQRTEREHADFPSLPRFIDRSAELFSRGTTAIRRIWPAGTSVVVLLTKPANS
jgi:hypothetical protein